MVWEATKVIRLLADNRVAILARRHHRVTFYHEMRGFYHGYCHLVKLAGELHHLPMRPRVARSPSSRHTAGVQLAAWQNMELSHTQSGCLISRTFPGVNIGAYPISDAAI